MNHLRLLVEYLPPSAPFVYGSEIMASLRTRDMERFQLATDWFMQFYYDETAKIVGSLAYTGAWTLPELRPALIAVAVSGILSAMRKGGQ